VTEATPGASEKLRLAVAAYFLGIGIGLGLAVGLVAAGWTLSTIAFAGGGAVAICLVGSQYLLLAPDVTTLVERVADGGEQR